MSWGFQHFGNLHVVDTTYTHVYIYIYMYNDMYIHTYMCIRLYTYICIYIYIFKKDIQTYRIYHYIILVLVSQVFLFISTFRSWRPSLVEVNLTEFERIELLPLNVARKGPQSGKQQIEGDVSQGEMMWDFFLENWGIPTKKTCILHKELPL